MTAVDITTKESQFGEMSALIIYHLSLGLKMILPKENLRVFSLVKYHCTGLSVAEIAPLAGDKVLLKAHLNHKLCSKHFVANRPTAMNGLMFRSQRAADWRGDGAALWRRRGAGRSQPIATPHTGSSDTHWSSTSRPFSPSTFDFVRDAGKRDVHLLHKWSVLPTCPTP